MKDFPPEAWRLIILNVLFQGGRLAVGAISSLYFLDKGFTLANFAELKSIQAIVFLSCDLPLGYILSRLGSYRSMFLGVMCGLLGAIGYIFSTDLISFMISEAFLALSLSIWPSSLGSYSMLVFKESPKGSGIIEKYFHFGDAISNFAIVVLGVVGAWLYTVSSALPYIIFVTTYFICAVFLSRKTPYKEEWTSKIRPKLFYNLVGLKKIWPFILILCLTQFALQPLLHYWQPFFKEEFSASTNEISLVFMVYSLTMSFTSSFFAFLNQYKFMRQPLVPVIIGGFASFYFFGFSYATSFVSALIYFSILFALINLVQVSTGVFIQKSLSEDERLNTSKQTSFIARLAMLSSLTFFGTLSLSYSMQSIFFWYGALAVLAFGGLSLIFYFFKNKEIYVKEDSLV